MSTLLATRNRPDIYVVIQLVPSSGHKMGIVMDSGMFRFSLYVVYAWLSVSYQHSSAASLMYPEFSITSSGHRRVIHSLQRHPGFRAHEFDVYVRVYEFLTASSSCDDAFNVVDGTQEKYESVYQGWFSREFLSPRKARGLRGSSTSYQRSSAASVVDPMLLTASKVVVDEGSILFNIAQVFALSFLWFVGYVRVYEFPTVSDTPGIVDVTREDCEADSTLPRE